MLVTGEAAVQSSDSESALRHKHNLSFVLTEALHERLYQHAWERQRPVAGHRYNHADQSISARSAPSASEGDPK